MRLVRNLVFCGMALALSAPATAQTLPAITTAPTGGARQNVQGALSALTLGPFTQADLYEGKTGDERIRNALASLRGPGVVQVTDAAGTEWGKGGIALGPGQFLELPKGATFDTCGMITFADRSGIIGLPTSNVLNGPVVIREAAGCNLPHVFNVSGQSVYIKDITVDGQQFYALQSLTITKPGGGYTSIPTVTVTGCSTAAFPVVAIAGGKVTHAPYSDFRDGFSSGRGCTATLACSITGGGGSGAQCIASPGPNLNPTGGSLIFASGLRPTFENVIATRSPTNGFELAAGASGAVWKNSTALLNQGDGILTRDVTDSTFETLTATENNLGWGGEFCNTAGIRFQNGDVGGNYLGGLRFAAVAQGYTTTTDIGNCWSASESHPPANSNMVTNTQFGFQVNGPEIQVDGSDLAHNGLPTSQDNLFSGNMILGCPGRHDNVAPAIKIANSAWNLVTGNSILDSTGQSYSTGVLVTQTAPGIDYGEMIVSNSIETIHSRVIGLTNTYARMNGPLGVPAIAPAAGVIVNSITGFDDTFMVNVTTGGSAVSGTIMTVSYSSPRDHVSFCTSSPTSDGGAAGFQPLIVAAASTNGFIVQTLNGSLPTSTRLAWYFSCP